MNDQVAGFSLESLADGKNTPFDVPLIYDDEGNPSHGLKCVGSNSDAYQAAERAWNLVNLKKSARRGRGIDATTEEGAKELADAIHRQTKALVYACVVEIYGFNHADGKPAEVNAATLDTLFNARPTWLEKTLAEIKADRGFLKP